MSSQLSGRLSVTLVCLLSLALPALASQEPPAAPAQPLTQRIQPILRARFPGSGRPPELPLAGGAAGETFTAAPGLPCFYDRRGYAPAWTGDTGLKPDADELLAALAEAPADGLDAERYRLAGLRQQLAAVRAHPTPGDLAEIDLRLTDAFLRLAADLRNGAVNPELIYNDCELDIPEVDLSAVLEGALAARRVRPALAELAPAHAGYKALKAALVQARALAARGGWPAVPDGPPLKPGDRNPRVAALRARLEASGDLTPPAAAAPTADRDLFDAALQEGLRKFQNRHGLDPDGAAGKGTLAALAAPAEGRVRQIEINLDRWRWLPRDLGERYIIVNIAGFQLDLIEGGAPALSMRVVAGKPTSRTPMFSGMMTNIVLNPYWNPPPGIVKKEILPHIARDSGYAEREGFEVIRNGSRVEVRQKPGPKNALGKVKFLFPNRFDVYLHDTPSRSLFSRTVRSFSHGCIRLEKPLELAEYLLKDDPAWTPKRIAAALAKGREQWAAVPRPLPVHLVYWTAWVDDAGTLQLRDDLYGRDKPLLEILGKDEPQEQAAP